MSDLQAARLNVHPVEVDKLQISVAEAVGGSVIEPRHPGAVRGDDPHR